jgi:hypothetical protein
VLAAVVIVAPLVLALVRPANDFFLVRNLSPAWIPICIALAAACAAPRARDLGTAAAMVLLLMFALATIEIDRNPVFQKADWRGVARALGSSTEPRAILVPGGQQAIPLKIFVHGVKWTQPPLHRPVLVDQVDVVGSLARGPLRGPGKHKGQELPAAAPIGAVLLGHKWVRNFDVARYELVHPWRLDTMQISARAGRFFRHRAPVQLLVLVAGGVPRRGPAPGAAARRVLAHPRGVRRRGIARHRGARQRRARSGRAGSGRARSGRARRRGAPRARARARRGQTVATDDKLTLQTVTSERCLMEVEPPAAVLRSYPCLRAQSPF